MSERHITFPPDAKFLDPETGLPVKVPHPDWKPKVIGIDPNGQPISSAPTDEDMVDHPERSFEWWLNVYILTHRIFAFDYGGYEASKAMREISKSCEAAIEAGETFFSVTADQDRMLRLTMARCSKKDEDDKIASIKSSRGMTRAMSNFEAGCFIDHMDAIMNSSTNKPEVKPPELPPVQAAAMELDQETEQASTAN